MTAKRVAIHFAVTSHGLGHLTRSVAVLKEIHAVWPDCALYVSTTINAAWIKSQLDFEVHWRDQGYEPGALQRNCFEVDVPATVRAYRGFGEQYQERLDRECEFLRSQPFIGVISDIAALPIRAAAEVGIPAVGISNFSWDWILEPWCAGGNESIVTKLAEDYGTGTRQLCLPFGPDRSSFPAYERAPLISRRAGRKPAEVRQALELPAGRIAVVCPGGWTADEWPAIRARCGDFQLVTVGDLPIDSDTSCRRLPHQLPAGLTLPDLVAAADVVVGKPGYGLASECVTHRVPFAMVERPNFRETPALVAHMARVGRCSVATLERFFSGDWQPMLEGALTGGSDWAEVDPDGARRVAERVVQLLKQHSGGG